MVKSEGRQAGSLAVPADYERLIDDIERRIASGELKPGEKLPSIRELAEQYETSQTTVKDALRILRREGTVRTQQGKGTWVADQPNG